MTMYYDIIFLSIIILLIFLYTYFYRFGSPESIIISPKTMDDVNEIIFEDKLRNEIRDEIPKPESDARFLIFESDKYKDIDEDLPWDEMESECKGESIDSIQNMMIGNLHRKRKITIF